MKKLLGLLLLLALGCGKPPSDSITLSALATDSIWTGREVMSSWKADSVSDSIIFTRLISTDTMKADTGYYWKEKWKGIEPVNIGLGQDPYLIKWQVNRQLKEVIRPVPVDIRPVCEDACPNCGGEMRLSNIACPEGRNGCDVLHTAWVCQSCGKEWYYDGDPP